MILPRVRGGEGEGLDAGEDLSPDEELAAIRALDKDTGERGEEEGHDLAGEADDAKHERGVGETPDEPAGGEAGHPGAHEGDALAGEEELEVAVTQGPPDVRDGGLGHCWRALRTLAVVAVSPMRGKAVSMR